MLETQFGVTMCAVKCVSVQYCFYMFLIIFWLWDFICAAWTLSGQFIWHSICIPGKCITFLRSSTRFLFYTQLLVQQCTTYAYLFSCAICRAMENLLVDQSVTRKERMCSATHAQEQVLVAVCTQQTQWHLLLRQWAWAFHTGANNIWKLLINSRQSIVFPLNHFTLIWLHGLTKIIIISSVFYLSKLFNPCWRPIKVRRMPSCWEVSPRIVKDGFEA